MELSIDKHGTNMDKWMNINGYRKTAVVRKKTQVEVKGKC